METGCASPRRKGHHALIIKLLDQLKNDVPVPFFQPDEIRQVFDVELYKWRLRRQPDDVCLFGCPGVARLDVGDDDLFLEDGLRQSQFRSRTGALGALITAHAAPLFVPSFVVHPR